MTDDELRALVREAIARHLGGDPARSGRGGRRPPRSGAPIRASANSWCRRGDDEGGPCLIEPTVHCNHCGFCQSYGH